MTKPSSQASEPMTVCLLSRDTPEVAYQWLRNWVRDY